MASGDPLPPDDHAVRFCDPTSLGAGGRITSAAFALRAIDRGEASVVWLECFRAGSHAANVQAAREKLRSVRSYHPDGKLAVLAVDRVRQLSVPGGRIDILHRPSKRNSCHSGILGLEIMTARQSMARLANAGEVHPAG